MLSGPDLTSQLVRVLITFRVGPVVFMANIQAMFYQLKVPEKRRSLWWNEGNLDSEITDHEMFVHFFGALSSPSSSNYEMIKVAVNSSSCCSNNEELLCG